MDKSIHSYMKPGTILHVSYPETASDSSLVLDRLDRIIDDCFFEAVEVTHIEDAEVRREAAARIHAAKLEAVFGGQGMTLGPHLSLCDESEDGREKAVAALKRGIDDACEMGCSSMQFMSGSPSRTSEEGIAAAGRQLVRSTRELCRYAEEQNLPLMCEVFDYDVDKKALIGPVKRAAAYAEEVCREFPAFGLLVDLSHIPLLHESIEESLLPAQKFLRHVHIGNTVVTEGAVAYGDTHPRFGFPGSANDTREVAEFLKTLFRIGYLGEGKRPIVSFETKPWNGEPANAVLANAKRTLQQAWNLYI